MTKLRELRARIILLKRHIVEEENGTFTENWEEGDSVWAQVIPWYGRESYGEGWNNFSPAHVKYKVTLRFRQVPFSRIKWGDILLALLCPPIIDQERQWMNCLVYVVGENDD